MKTKDAVFILLMIGLAIADWKCPDDLTKAIIWLSGSITIAIALALYAIFYPRNTK